MTHILLMIPRWMYLVAGLLLAAVGSGLPSQRPTWFLLAGMMFGIHAGLSAVRTEEKTR